MSESSDISQFSFEKEKAIAKSFSNRFQWEMILIGLGQAAIWLLALATSFKWFFRFMDGVHHCKFMCMFCLSSFP